MDWYKHDIGAYRRRTSLLRALGHGIYRLLLDEYYAGQGPLPNDLNTLYAIAKVQTESEKNTAKTVIDQYFPLNGDGMRHNARADEELEEYRKRRETKLANLIGRPNRHTVTASLNGSLIGNPTLARQTNKYTNKETGDGGFVKQKVCITCGQRAVEFMNYQWHCADHIPYKQKT